MKTDLTQEQIDFYQENGYIIIEDFLTPRGVGNLAPACRRRRGKARMIADLPMDPVGQDE